ncbi:MAG: hypothetical protein H8E98_06095 [Bacteroidetes bacterium]|nr:hypothetical protein [Bacteroidota bacterium]
MTEKIRQIIREEIKKQLNEGSAINKADNAIYRGLSDLRRAIEKEKPEAIEEFRKIKKAVDAALNKFYSKYNL